MLLFHLVSIVAICLLISQEAFAGSSVIAGGSSAIEAFTGSGLAASQTDLGKINYITTDKAGNLIASLTDYHVIVKIDKSSNIVTVLAGTIDKAKNYKGNMPITEAISDAGFYQPQGVWLDNDGNLFIADRNSVVRKIDASLSTVTRVAGSGRHGARVASPVLSGSPLTVDLGNPSSLWGDKAGNLFIYDLGCLFRSSGDSITVFAGQFNNYGFLPNANPLAIKIRGSGQIAGDSQGNIFFADSGNGVYWKISADGQTASIIAGSSTAAVDSSIDCSEESNANHPLCFSLRNPFGLFIDQSNNGDKIYLTAAHVNSAAPDGSLPDRVLSYSPASISQVFTPSDNPASLASDGSGGLFVAYSSGVSQFSSDSSSRRLRG